MAEPRSELPVWDTVVLGPKTMNNKLTQAFGAAGFPNGEASGLQTSFEVSEFSQPRKGIFQFFVKQLSCPFPESVGSPGAPRGDWGLLPCPHPPPGGRKREVRKDALQFSPLPPSYPILGDGDSLALVPQIYRVQWACDLGKLPQSLRP